jgi:hypothetical protein
MSQPLLSVLGAILIQDSFREGMRIDPKQTLKDFGIVLSKGEHEILAKIVADLRSGALDDATHALSVVCPVWPCDRMALVKYDAAAGFYGTPAV